MSEFLDLVNNLRTSNQQVAISSSADPANDFGNDAVRNVAIALQTGQQANSVNFDLAKSYITRFCDSSVSSSVLYNVSDAAKPSFNYARNSISIPSRSANPGLYNDKGAFYNQIFHEVSHYTRAQLGISGVISGTPEYQKEEVIAEMTACKMMMNCGFPVDNLRTSARYIDAWANEYVKNLPEAEKAAAKAELLSDAEKSADEALKLVHLNIGMNQRYETNQDLKMRLIVPADEVKLALARGVRQDEKGYYVRISDDFSKFERWSEKNMLETAIQYSRKAVNEAAPEIRQDKENELNTAIQEAQKQAEAEEAQKASVVTSSADNIDQREEISVASSEQSNAPNVPDSNSVNASLIAEMQRMQQQLAELQKQLAATQKENEELRNGQHQQRAENAGRAGENSGVNKSDNGEISGRRAGELQKDTSGHGTEIYVDSMGISPDENDKQTLGEDSSPVLSPRAERGGNAAERDNDKVLQSGLHSGSNVNHQQSGSEAGITGNSGNFEGSRRLDSDSGRDIEASGHSQDEVSAGNLYGQGDIPRAGNRNDGSVYEGLRQSDGSDIQMVEEGRSRTADTSVLPGEQTGNRGSADRFSEHSDNSRAVSDNSGRDDGANRSSDRRGGEGRETGGNRGTSDHAGRRLSDGTSGNVREEGASGLSSDGGRLVSESGRGRSEQLQGEILGGSGSVLESAVASQNTDNAVKESDAQEVHPITAEQTEIRESSAQQSENEEEAFPKTQEEYDSLRYIELSDQEKHDAVTMAVWEWVSWQGSLAELTEQTDDLVKREQQQQFENILIDRVTEKLSKSGWASLVQFARTPVESPFYDESRYVALEEVLDQIDYIYRIHKEEINNALFSVNEQQQALAAEENNKEANTVTQTETHEPVQKSEERTENVVSEQQNISQSVSENTTEQTASSPSDDVLPEIKEKRAKKSRKKKNSDQIDLFDDVQNKADENQETTNEDPVISSAATEPAPSAVSEKAEAEQEPSFTIADNWEIHDDDSRATTPVDRFVRNLEAIETLRKIQNEGDRPATKEEQEKLAQFSGWGGLGSQFYVNDNSSALEKERRQRLMDLLGEEEFYKARASSITAYYTDPVVARSIYQALENAGFKGGNILEPSCGTGIFFGTMPRDMMANSVINGVELEPTTAQIAQKLYPTVKIKNCGYEKSGQRNDSYDVVIGNVPFGNFSVVDGKYSDKRDLIHNYFIDKSIDQVKPGGIVALITSSSTLEDKDPEFRTRIAEKAELMGAIRLPDNAFSHTGTNVQTDILFFKKRKERIQNVSETENPWIATTKYQLLDSYSNSKSLFLQNVYDSGNCNNSKFINKVELKDRFYKNVSWADWKSKDNDFLIEKSLPSLNDYYRQNSAMCINYNTLNKNQYGKLQLATTESLDLKQDLDNKIQLIRGTFSAEASKEEGVKKLDPEDYPEIKYFSFGIINGKIYHKRPSGMILAEGLKINETDSKAKETIKDISGLKKCLELKQIYFQTLNAMLSDATDDEVKNLQSELVDKYNQVREELGIKKDASLFLSNANAMKAFRLDSEFSKIKVMENIKDVYEPTVKTKTTTDKISGEKTTEQVEATKHIRLFTGLSDICKKRVLHKYDTSYHADNSISALDLSLGVKGYVDFSFMSQISSKPADDIKKELSDNSLIFRDLDDADKWLPKEEFLSGDIQAKLIKAEKLQESDTSFATEVKALKEAMPRPVKFDEIDIGVSSPFVPVDILARYVAQEMDCSESDVNVTRKLSGEYSVLLRRVGAGAMSYSLDGLKLNEFVSKVLNHKPIAFFHDKEHKNIDKERTFAGNITYRERFEQNFKSYISKISAEDRIRIEESYNRSFNTIVHRKYDGNKLLFAGISSEIKLRDHQKDAVARCIYGGNTLLAHEVGAGKTFTICAAAMEMKRLGLSQKPLIAVPGAVVGQWEDEFQRLYPNANILVVKKGDMSPGSINSTIMKMALNDWDSIIISHGDLAKIPVANETIDLVLHEREKEIRQIADEDDDLTPGQREEFIISNMNKLHKRVDKIREKYANGNAILTMGDIGIDKLFVDESHEFKNLKVETTLDNIVGLSKSEALKTEDMFIKTTYLNNKSNYHAVYFASGTPISNTLGELYSVQKYLQPQILDSSGCNTFQKWADTFVNITYDRQVSMTGKTLNMKMQMKEFKNIPALLNMYWKCGDVVMTDDLGLNLPKVERKNVIIKPTENQEELIERITQRMADIEKRRVDPKKDNKLCIAGDSRKIGMDPRLLREKNLERMGMTEDEIGQGNKIDTVCANVYKIYKETDAQKSTQVIFSDIGVPNKDGYFSVYDEIKDQLIQRGIPANEIAIIHDYPKDDDKKALFGRLNAGDIRVVIGSTGKLGTGCNFQKKLIAAHHVDAPWRPSDITQREGRIKRQGNENSSVQIFTYATEKTFDAYMYDTLARKQEYIKTIFSGKEKIQRTEDLGEVELDYRSMRIATCGDQNLKKKLELLDNIKNHRMIKSAEEDKLQKFKDEISFLLPNRIEASNRKIAEYSYAVELRKAHPPIINEKGERIFSGFEMPDGRELTDKKDMMTWLQNSRPGHIGSYRGFQIYKFYLRDNGTGEMTYKIGITPKKFDSLLEQQNFGNDRSNTTLIFGGIEHNWDSRIDKWADKLNDELKFVEEKQKEINDASITIQAIEKEIQFQNDLIAEAQKEYDELESQSQTKSEDMEQFDSEKADTSALQDVECDSSDIVELLNEREKDDEEESQYSLPEGYEDQYYEPVGQEAQDLIPEEDKRHYIDVPFNEKNEAKSLGAKWDQENKGWYVPEGVNMADFAKWPEKQKSEMPARDYIKVPMKDKDEAKALGARWDKDNKLWFIPKNANADLFAKWPRTSIAEKKAEQERKPVYTPRVTLYVPFSRKDEAKKLGAYWDVRSKQWTCKAEDKAKFSEFLKPLPKTESKVRENTDRINHEPNVQSAMLRDLASAGVRVDAVSIQNTGKWLRVPLIDDKPGEKTGMLAIHLDGVPTMKFVNFRHPELSIPMNTENKVRLYVGDLEQIKQSPQAGDRLKTVTEEAKARIAANQAAREAEREKAQKSAQAKSEYFSKMPPASDNSQYLVSKGIKPSPDLHQNQKSGDLFVPFYDADGQIKTTQIIHADGRKQFIEGGQKVGAFHPLDGIQSLAERDTIYICEGYATANTIREATKEKMAVVAAGDCGNLLSVATAIHEKFPEKAIVIAGDDDRFNEVNSGRNHAESTARAIGASVVFPDFDGNSTGTDFNDMAKEKGIEAVREVLRNEYRQHRSAAEAAAPENQPEKAKKPGYRR